MNLTERFKAYIPVIKETLLFHENPDSIDFIKKRTIISREMKYCLETQNLVGVYSNVLGHGMFLVGVQEILLGDNGNELFVFYSHDMSGHKLSRRTLAINEIESIVPFNNRYIIPRPNKITVN